MKNFSFLVFAFVILGLLFSCNADPSSPGGKLGSKNYGGNYTMGATSGTAYTYLSATGDTLIDLRYSLNSAPAVTLTNVTFKDSSGYYTINKLDAIGNLHGATTSNFQTLTWQYTTSGTTIGFTGTKIQ